ncbi:Glutamate-1-semialdehyde 2,1-aminomutase [Posidoniimonas polymericola]|uniref:Glutamate-1-semialdehyde 2,1-aminomutase n=1 Tax=Posidoniimonas polymericola TaxID=2528002 RepID=A0A5C5YMJ5_9BACT|nr:aminotransferase class III-fold pyridoxal phosphate-dependent enzyme [Posidoniimonas polymericola]TWT76050.1 Glutamate-1-semialdehyde 2,1-aminomutase [Posidoniimonas polymericola]
MVDAISKRAWAAFPAGSNGEFNLPEVLTKVVVRGEGPRLWTADGAEMLDFSMGWGSVLVGHADPRICVPVAARIGQGANFASVTDASLELAERLIDLSPACDQVRFCASGTEATMYCLRLARAATGRRAILRFEGAYHGAHDVGVTSLFPDKPTPFPTAAPSCDGLTAHEENGVLVAPFNDLDTTAAIIEHHRETLAGVIVEPLQRCLPPAPGFLEGLRDITSRCGIKLIFDEVVTGFRLAYAGAQEYYGVVPDLVAYGKALGGGFPIGVFGGVEDVMNLAAEHRMGADGPYVWTASTLGGNPISATAALATLDVLERDGVYQQLHSLGDYLRAGMRRALDEIGVEAQVLGDGPLAQFAFTGTHPVDFRTSQHRDKQFARRFMLRLFERGIYLNPMGTKLYLSLAHDKGVCDQMLVELTAALAETTEARPVSA